MPKRQTGKADERLVIISCRAPRRVRQRLEALARAARRSQSSYLRLLIEDAVREPGRVAATLKRTLETVTQEGPSE